MFNLQVNEICLTIQDVNFQITRSTVDEEIYCLVPGKCEVFRIPIGCDELVMDNAVRRMFTLARYKPSNGDVQSVAILIDKIC